MLLPRREGFSKWDQTEWGSVTGVGAVKVWKGAEAQRLREKYTLRSRVVRRKKLMPGVGCFSRWCVLGLDDPDGDNLFAATQLHISPR